jgi:uncharacterized membrane protein (Fun14 family)
MEAARPLPGERDRPRLDLPDVFWFFGAITAVIASIAILDRVPESNADVWLLLASLGFLVAYGAASLVLYRRGLSIAGGLMATVSAAMVAAVGYAFTQLIDLYPDDPFFQPFSDFSGTVFGIGIATALGALLAFALTRFSFVLALLVGAALVSVQLLTPAWSTSGDDRALSGVISGAVAVGIGLLLDAAARRRHAFWFYVGGYFAIAAALTYYVVNGYGNGGGPSGAWIALLVVGAAVLLGGAVLGRQTWAAYGALGVYSALFHYLNAHEWMRYVLLGVSLGAFVLGLAVAAQRRPATPAAPPPAPEAP